MDKPFGWNNGDFSVDDLSELSRPLFGALEGFQFDLNLYSMSNYAGLFTLLADVCPPRSVAEIGVFEGRFSEYLMAAFAGVCERFDFIDLKFSAEARQRIEDRAADRSLAFELFEEKSTDYLGRQRPVDWCFIDGDHNYETVSRELALIGAFPAARRLVVCHDTGWPCARWDSAYDPELLDGDAVFRPGMLSPFSAVPVDDYGLELPFVDERESSARRGVLTAVEDFLRDNPHFGHLKFTPFYGLSVLWDRRQFSEGDNDRLVSLPAHPGLNTGIIEKLELNRLMLLISLQRAGRIWKQQQSYIGELEKRLQRSSSRDA